MSLPHSLPVRTLARLFASGLLALPMWFAGCAAPPLPAVDAVAAPARFAGSSAEPSAPAAPGDYEIYPAYPLPAGQIELGYDALAARLAGQSAGRWAQTRTLPGWVAPASSSCSVARPRARSSACSAASGR